MNENCGGKKKIVVHWSLNSPACREQLSDTENRAIGKTDNVKSFPGRQGKAKVCQRGVELS
jgi:hypothetical protein